MDNKLFNIGSKSYVKESQLNKLELKEIVEANSFNMLGVKILLSNYFIDKDSNNYIESLGIDEDYRIVIIEYRVGKFSRIIKKGLDQIDYIKSRLSLFKMMMSDILKDESKNIDYKARLIVVGTYFSKSDGDTIKHLPYNIDLVRIQKINDNILVNKTYVSKNVEFSDFKYNPTENEKKIYIELQDFILSLGEEITATASGNVVSFRSLKVFLYVIFNQGISVIINGSKRDIKSIDEISLLEKEIEMAYDDK